jgi:HK97 family phage major capsid protein
VQRRRQSIGEVRHKYRFQESEFKMTTEMREEYAKLHTEAGKVLSDAAAAKRALTVEEKTANDARYSRMDAIKAQSEAEKTHAKYAFESGAVTNQADPKAKEEFAAAPDVKTAEGLLLDLKPDHKQFATYRKELNAFLRPDTASQRFTIITTTGSSVMLPKAVLPPDSVRRNNNAFRAVLGATGYNPLETTDTQQYTLPIFDDTGVVGFAPSENGTTSTTADSSLTTNSVTLNAVLYSSKTRWFSNTLLNANGFDILAYITPILQKTVDKTEESAWTTTLAALTAPTTVTASKAAITYPTLLAWEHKLAVAYRSDAAFIVSDTLYQTLRGLVDNNNRPIMDLDPTNVFQMRMHGKPIFVSDFLSAMGTANGFAGAFLSGDAIKLRDVIPQRLTRYVNIPTSEDQTGYCLFANGDCQFAPAGVSLLQLAAS